MTNTFNMTDEEWEAEAKTSKYVEKLRNAPLLYLDLCIQLFDGATATGVHGWGPSSTQPHTAEEYLSQDFDDIQCTQMETPTEPAGASEESSAHSKKMEKKKRQRNDWKQNRFTVSKSWSRTYQACKVVGGKKYYGS